MKNNNNKSSTRAAAAAWNDCRLHSNYFSSSSSSHLYRTSVCTDLIYFILFPYSGCYSLFFFCIFLGDRHHPIDKYIAAAPFKDGHKGWVLLSSAAHVNNCYDNLVTDCYCATGISSQLVPASNWNQFRRHRLINISLINHPLTSQT